MRTFKTRDNLPIYEECSCSLLFCLFLPGLYSEGNWHQPYQVPETGWMQERGDRTPVKTKITCFNDIGIKPHVYLLFQQLYTTVNQAKMFSKSPLFLPKLLRWGVKSVIRFCCTWAAPARYQTKNIPPPYLTLLYPSPSDIFSDRVSSVAVSIPHCPSHFSHSVSPLPSWSHP